MFSCKRTRSFSNWSLLPLGDKLPINEIWLLDAMKLTFNMSHWVAAAWVDRMCQVKISPGGGYLISTLSRCILSTTRSLAAGSYSPGSARSTRSSQQAHMLQPWHRLVWNRGKVLKYNRQASLPLGLMGTDHSPLGRLGPKTKGAGVGPALP